MTGHSRFWWRALDAHLPAETRAPVDPVPSSRPRPSPERPSLNEAAVVALANPPAPAKPSLKLEIPKSDRRPQRRVRAKGGSRGRFALAAAIFLAGSAGTAAALFTGALQPQRVQLLLSSEAQQALLGLGFGIEQVSLSGHNFTPDSEIYDALGLDSARTLAAFDAPAALRRLEALSWVETAQITRVFPGSLRVDIRERRPSALWLLKGRFYLVDPSGRVLGATADAKSWNLPRIAGEGANVEASLLFTALARHPEIAAAVDHAARISGRRWSLVLKNGSRIELGADRDVEGLEQVARNSELRRALSGPPMVADVRTPGRLALRLAHAAMEVRQ